MCISLHLVLFLGFVPFFPIAAATVALFLAPNSAHTIGPVVCACSRGNLNSCIGTYSNICGRKSFDWQASLTCSLRTGKQAPSKQHSFASELTLCLGLPVPCRRLKLAFASARMHTSRNDKDEDDDKDATAQHTAI